MNRSGRPGRDEADLPTLDRFTNIETVEFARWCLGGDWYETIAASIGTVDGPPLHSEGFLGDARLAAWAQMFCRWKSTVVGATVSAEAACWLMSPSAVRRRMSTSRSVSSAGQLWCTG